MSADTVGGARELAGDISRPEFWREHFPDLSLPGDNHSRLGLILATATAAKVSEADPAVLAERMSEEGYFQDRSETFELLAPVLADAVRTCQRLNIPPAFIFLFEEPWACFRSLRLTLSRFLGPGYLMLPDFWTWYVNPAAGEAGWTPHRDKGRQSLAPDGSPLSLTVWAPLSDATPLSSCIYVLPANRDPVYNTPQENSPSINPASVRALPGTPGDVFCWNQAVLHWGSESSRFSPHPRISMAMEFQRGDVAPFNRPLISPSENMSFDMRLKLVSKQILQYRHMYPLDPKIEALARSLLSS